MSRDFSTQRKFHLTFRKSETLFHESSCTHNMYKKTLFSIYDVYLKFPKIQTLSGQLSWSHNSEIIKVDDKFVNKGAYSW